MTKSATGALLSVKPFAIQLGAFIMCSIIHIVLASLLIPAGFVGLDKLESGQPLGALASFFFIVFAGWFVMEWLEEGSN